MSKEPVENFQTAYYYVKGNVPFTGSKVSVNAKFWCKVSQRCYQTKNVDISAKDLSRVCQKRVDRLLSTSLKALKSSCYVSIGAFVFFLIFFGLRGFLTRKKKTIQANELAHPWQVKLKMKLLSKSSKI